MKILIVDDDAVTRETLRDILSRQSDWEVFEASDGEVAWDMLENGYRPDLCLIDLMMPRLDGMSLLEKMRDDKRYVGIKVLMVTLTNDRSVVMKAIDLKISGYLLKPYTAARVIAQIKKVEATLPKGPAEEDPGAVLEAPDKVIARLEISHQRYLRMVDILLTDTEAAVADIEKSLESFDILNAIARLDGIKGSCVTLGAHKLREVAVSAKLDGKTDDVGNLRKALEEVQTKAAEIREQFDSLGLLNADLDNSEGTKPSGDGPGAYDILLVEDKEAIVEQFTRNLASDFWRVSHVPSQAKAMERTMQSAPDLVIVSLSLPDDGAFSFFRFLRSSGKNQQIPIFGLSIKTNTKEQALAKERGFDAIITKPVDYKALQVRCERLFNLDTSEKYYSTHDGVLQISLPAGADTNTLNEIEGYLESRLADAINQGVSQIVFDLLAVKTLDMDLVRFLVEANERCEGLSLQTAMVGGETVAASCHDFEESDQWQFYPSVEAVLEQVA